MSEKKVVARTTAIALAVLCILLLVGIVGTVIYYNQTINNQNTAYANLQSQNSAYMNDHSHTNEDYESLKSQLTDAQNQLSTANNQSIVTNLQNQINSLQSQLDSANSQLTTANSQISNLNSINSLQKTSVVANDQTVSQANGAYSTFSLSASYAGYVSVYVQSSTVTGTWVEVIYSSHGVNYNQAYTGSQAIHAGSSAVFPVLPSSSITIGVGNGLSTGSGATETVTITYYY